MARRYIGDATVQIRYTGNERDEYVGTVSVPSGTWHFEELYPPRIGFSFAYDGPEAYDRMAASAVGFASYYSSLNRGPDVPEWAPPAELADDIEAATSWAMDDRGDYDVRRRR